MRLSSSDAPKTKVKRFQLLQTPAVAAPAAIRPLIDLLNRGGGQIRFGSDDSERRSSFSRPCTPGVRQPGAITPATEMIPPALPKLPARCCSGPLNSAAIPAIQTNHSGRGGREGGRGGCGGGRHSKICMAIFSGIMASSGRSGIQKRPHSAADAT